MQAAACGGDAALAPPRGGRCFRYRPGGRYLKYRPPPPCLPSVGSDFYGQDRGAPSSSSVQSMNADHAARRSRTARRSSATRRACSFAWGSSVPMPTARVHLRAAECRNGDECTPRAGAGHWPEWHGARFMPSSRSSGVQEEREPAERICRNAAWLAGEEDKLRPGATRPPDVLIVAASSRCQRGGGGGCCFKVSRGSISQ